MKYISDLQTFNTDAVQTIHAQSSLPSRVHAAYVNDSQNLNHASLAVPTQTKHSSRPSHVLAACVHATQNINHSSLAGPTQTKQSFHKSIERLDTLFDDRSKVEHILNFLPKTRRDYVLDPNNGSGGLNTQEFDHLRKNYDEKTALGVHQYLKSLYVPKDTAAAKKKEVSHINAPNHNKVSKQKGDSHVNAVPQPKKRTTSSKSSQEKRAKKPKCQVEEKTNKYPKHMLVFVDRVEYQKSVDDERDEDDSFGYPESVIGIGRKKIRSRKGDGKDLPGCIELLCSWVGYGIEGHTFQQIKDIQEWNESNPKLGERCIILCYCMKCISYFGRFENRAHDE